MKNSGTEIFWNKVFNSNIFFFPFFFSSFKRSNIEEEYYSEDPSSCSEDAEENSTQNSIEEEVKKVCKKIDERDTKYVIDPNKEVVNLDEPSSVLQAVKRKRDEERREDKWVYISFFNNLRLN